MAWFDFSVVLSWKVEKKGQKAVSKQPSGTNSRVFLFDNEWHIHDKTFAFFCSRDNNFSIHQQNLDIKNLKIIPKNYSHLRNK